MCVSIGDKKSVTAVTDQIDQKNQFVMCNS